MGEKPKLTVVGSAKPVELLATSSEVVSSKIINPALRMDVVIRESHCRMIRHFQRRWGAPMQVLIDQACFGYMGIEQLADDELIQLHKDLERAEDCMRDGVSFEDAGLLRSRYG